MDFRFSIFDFRLNRSRNQKPQIAFPQSKIKNQKSKIKWPTS